MKQTTFSQQPKRLSKVIWALNLTLDLCINNSKGLYMTSNKLLGGLKVAKEGDRKVHSICTVTIIRNF